MSLINKAAVKRLALAAAETRFKGIPGYGMNRVSGSFTDRMEADLRGLVVRETGAALDKMVEDLEQKFHDLIVHAIQTLPSVGQTIR